jgi:hypothetical protein
MYMRQIAKAASSAAFVPITLGPERYLEKTSRQNFHLYDALSAIKLQ